MSLALRRMLASAFRSGSAGPALLVAALLIAFWLGNLSLHQSRRAELRADALHQTASMALGLESQLRHEIETVDDLLLQARALYLASGRDWKALLPLLSAGHLGKRALQLGLIGPDGYLLETSIPRKPGAKPVDLSDREHFRIHKARGDDLLFVSRPVQGRVSGQWSLQFTRRLNDEQGRFAGVLVLSMPPAVLLSSVDLFKATDHDHVAVLTGGLELVGSSGPIAGRLAPLTPLPSALAQRMAAPAGTFFATHLFSPAPAVLAYRRIPEANVVAVVTADAARLNARLIEVAVIHGAFGLLVTFLILVLVLGGGRARRRVEKERSLFRALYRAIPDLVWIKDREGRYLACNPAVEAYFGAADNEITGKTDFDFVDAEAARAYRQKDEEAIAARGPRSNEEWITYPDGRRALLETTKVPVLGERGGVLGVLGVGRDITERQEQAQSLRRDRARYRAILDATAEGIMLVDREHGLVDHNPAAREILGIRPEDVGVDYPPPHPRLYREDGAELAREDFPSRRCLETGAPQTDITLMVQRRDGELRWVKTNVLPVFLEDEKVPTAVVVSFADITGIKLAEQRLRAQSRVLELLAQGAPLQDILDACTTSMEALGRHADDPPLCALWLLDQAGGVLRRASAPSLPEAFRQAVDGLAIGERVGSCGTAAWRGERVVVEDVRSDPLWADYRELAAEAGLVSCWSEPVRGRDGRLLGVFSVYHRGPRLPAPQDLGDLQWIARLAGIALEHRFSEMAVTRLNLVLEASPYMVAMADAAGRLFYLNSAGRTLVGFGPGEDLAGQDMTDLVPERLLESHRSGAMAEAVRRGHWRGETVLLTREGLELPVSQVLVCHPDERGKPAYFSSISRDISAQRAASERLRLLARAFSQAREGFVVTDAEGSIIDVNESMLELCGYGRDELLGQNPRLFKSGQQDEGFYADMWSRILGTGLWRGEVCNKRKDGTLYVSLLTISAVRDEAGRLTHFVGVHTEITQLKQQQAHLQQIAHYDALTGLPNRVLFFDRFEQAVARAKRQADLLAVCFLDLDGFKPINDAHGHDAGDRVLQEVGRRLRHATRGEDTVARVGGDEFALLLGGLASVEQCQQTLLRLLATVSMPIGVGQDSLSVSASFGVTLFPLDDTNPDTLLRHADEAMYVAKRKGRNRFHFFDPEQDQLEQERQVALARIDGALERGEFRLYYQPKVNMRRGEVVGVEALIRWQDPQRGLLSPAKFLPLVEGSDRCHAVGEWVIAEALRQLEAWKAEGLHLPISVNIFPRQLQEDSFVERLRELIAGSTAYCAGLLEFEIVESVALDDLSLAQKVIGACRELGIAFALDDFGTGYSSLTYFKQLAADILKVDQSFVADMLNDPEDLSIVEGVISLAQSFGRGVIAEGVESAEHGLLLLRLGCDLGQGYGIAAPMPAAEIPAWVRSYRIPEAWQSEPANAVAREHLPLLFLIAEHRQWVRQLEAAVASTGGATPFPPLEVDQCRFGLWYGAEGRERYGGQPRFCELEEVHEELHRLGQAIHDLVLHGAVEHAWGLLPELRRVSADLLSRLEALQRAVSPGVERSL